MTNLDQYTPPTRLDYVKFLLKFPSMDEANTWANLRFSDGPMNEEEYNRHLETFSDDLEFAKENADRINRLRSRTAFGFYLASWGDFFARPFKYSYKDFCNDNYESFVENQYAN